MEVLSYVTHSKSSGIYLITFRDVIDDTDTLYIEFAPYSKELLSGDETLNLQLLKMRDKDMIYMYLSRFGHIVIV